MEEAPPPRKPPPGCERARARRVQFPAHRSAGSRGTSGGANNRQGQKRAHLQPSPRRASTSRRPRRYDKDAQPWTSAQHHARPDGQHSRQRFSGGSCRTQHLRHERALLCDRHQPEERQARFSRGRVACRATRSRSDSEGPQSLLPVNLACSFAGARTQAVNPPFECRSGPENSLQ